MTFEEMQTILREMLSVQRQLQETQIKQSEEIKDLIAQGKEQDRRIQQLVGYSISQAGDVIDVQMALRDVYARLSKIENAIQQQQENEEQ